MVILDFAKKLNVNLLFVSAAMAAHAYADDGAGNNAISDTSVYTVFNPAPDNQLQDFCTDRPTKSNLPCTVDAGHFQYEADAFNWTYNHTGNLTQNTYLYTNPTFKIGITRRSDVEINIAPLVEVNAHNNLTHTTTDLTGMGDLYLRYKYNLIGYNGGDMSLTLLPYVKAPSADPGIGNKQVEGGLIVPVSFALPQKFTLLFDPEIDAFKNTADDGYHNNYQLLANISHSLFVESVTGYAELWSEVSDDPSGASTQASFDLSLSWLMRPNLQLDVGTNIGLNSKTPELQSYAGISQRF